MLTIQTLSQKQRKTLNWWVPDSPVRDAYGIIADGSIRAGKTLSMGIGFIEWAMGLFDGKQFIMCGKTVGSFRRNVLSWMIPYLIQSGYRIAEKRTENTITVTGYGNTNTFHIFGGRDESSQDLVQGITAAGAFFDEVALMPESFVNQATGRCSEPGAKLWFNCNPGGPSHWFKVNWLEKLKEKNMLHLHYTMDDNPALTDERRAFYASLYTGGVFYKRYILGLWVQAEGAIYDMLTDENYYDTLPKSLNRPAHYIGIDYGTQNDTAFLHIIDDGTTLWVDKEYYYSGRDTGKQKTNSQYAKDLVGFCEGIDVYRVIIDPSAASFKVELRNNGFRLKDADNDVLDGIRYVATMFGRRLIKINRRCVNLRREIEGYVWDPKPTEKGNEKPIKSSDHGCFAVGTMVKTRRGDVPIEQITTDDEILTPLGYSAVEGCGQTGIMGTIKISGDGFNLECTPDHPLRTQSGMFTPALWCDNVTLLVNKELAPCGKIHPTPLSSMAEATIGMATIICRVVAALMAVSAYMLQFGNFTTGQSLKNITSTTLTKIAGIITLATLSAYLKRFIYPTIWTKTAARGAVKISKTPSPPPLCGIDPTLGESGIVATQRKYGKTPPPMLSIPALYAAHCLKLRPLKLNIVRTIVSLNIAASMVLTTSKPLAPTVVESSLKTNTAGLKHATASVVEVLHDKTRQPVYNLTLEKYHCYYANGVLVSNCDALRYVIKTVVSPRRLQA